MIKYKIDVLDALRQRGYNSVRLRKEKILGESIIQKIRTNDTRITVETLNTICIILRCQISDILEVVATDEEKIKYF